MQEISQSRLRYFHEVVACGSIRGAAEKLNSAASVISRQIQLLEKELGLPLFERRARGLVPTEAADMLLEYHRGCRAQHEHLSTRLQELRGMQRGNLQLAISEGFVDDLTARVIGPFCIDYPQLNVGIQVRSVNEVVEAVATDCAHIGLAYSPPAHPAIRCRFRKVHPVCLLVGRDHPLAGHEGPVTLADAMRYPLALMTAPYGLRQIIDVVEFTERIHLTPALTTNSLQVLKQFVRSGAGVTFMPVLGARLEIERGELAALPVAHPVLLSPECQAIVRLGRPLPTAANELLRRIGASLPVFAD
ncbi:LysR family transcriptional regulator [Cupriavidus basilensis]|uniref:LysR family transcriptional regulator n=1 Tax=Cupriavidus basilensis TaxID=68895 RepID=A0ABT6AUE5_9BURK|nr:LysR family transcriptional regulator [Cupriavidus basilensis]MDF3836234.1 LysR family transcriptional regulator [Cupriavidus basilensis]